MTTDRTARGSIPGITVYWQPGCTSCLRAKELLAAHGIAFRSVNVRTEAGAMEELERLGVRTVPVVSRGREYVLAQDVDELARFLGIEVRRDRLSSDELAARLQALLAAAETLVAAMPQARLQETLPQRERTWLDLGFHVSMIVQGLLTAGTGGVLTYEMYERRAPGAWSGTRPAVGFSRATRQALDSWWTQARRNPDLRVRTYFGGVPLASLLERTAWHVAQHCRQLDHLVHEVAGASGGPRLPVELLEGLPLPEAVWDVEVKPE